MAAIEENAQHLSPNRIAPRLATVDELTRVHSSKYIEELIAGARAARESGQAVPLDQDTWMSEQSYDVARLAAGAGCVAVESVLARAERNAFVLVRPGGHHALRDRAMGFCLLNNVAVATRHAQDQCGKKRILILDWDVHHGNGTQSSFYYDPSVCVVSLHREWPFWPPDSGLSTEIGSGEGRGFNINIPLPVGTGDRGYLSAWDTLVEPIVREFEPDLVLLSAGYDAHELDPIGGQKLSSHGYFVLSKRLADIADRTDAPVVAFLEGGYNLQALAEGVLSTMEVLNCRDSQERTTLRSCVQHSETLPQTSDANTDAVEQRISKLQSQLRQFWRHV